MKDTIKWIEVYTNVTASILISIHDLSDSIQMRCEIYKAWLTDYRFFWLSLFFNLYVCQDLK